MDNGKIIQRKKALEGSRSGFNTEMDLIQRFVLPFTGNFYGGKQDENEIDWRQNREVYDSTAIIAAGRLAASIQSGLASAAERWFDLAFRDKTMKKNKEYQMWIEDTAERIYAALQESNFDKEIGKAFLYLVTYAYSVVVEEADGESWEGLDFSTIPVRNVYFDENAKKGVYGLYQEHQMTPLQMIDKFGEDGVPDRIKDAAEDSTKRMTKEEVIFCVWLRDITPDPGAKVLTPTQRPYGYKYILVAGAEDLGDEGGYYEMPAFIARWRETADSRWGNSPANQALPTILSLNQLMSAVLTGIDKVVDPPILTTEDGIIGNLELEHGELNVVRSLDGIEAFAIGSDFVAATNMVADMRNQILEIFHQDILQLKESPTMTATEVNARREDMFRFLNPTAGLLQNDLLTPIVERTYRILMRAGRLMEMPEGMEQADVDIEFTGPLARAQKMRTADQMTGWLERLAINAEVFPDMLDIPDVDKMAREIGNMMGVPAEFMKDDKQVKAERKKRADAQQAQMKAEQDNLDADTINKTAGGMAKAAEIEGGAPGQAAANG